MSVIWALATPIAVGVAGGAQGITPDLLVDVKAQMGSKLDGATILETRGSVHVLALTTYSAALEWAMGLQVCSETKIAAGQAAYEDPSRVWSDWFCYEAHVQAARTQEVSAGVFLEQGREFPCHSGGQRKLSRGNTNVVAVFKNRSALTVNFEIAMQFLIKLP